MSPWGTTCRTCVFWNNYECRQSAPVANAQGGFAVWPVTRALDWCGDHSETVQAAMDADADGA